MYYMCVLKLHYQYFVMVSLSALGMPYQPNDTSVGSFSGYGVPINFRSATTTEEDEEKEVATRRFKRKRKRPGNPTRSPSKEKIAGESCPNSQSPSDDNS